MKSLLYQLDFEYFRISPKEMALAFFDELEGGIISIIDVVAKFGKIPDLCRAFLT